MPFCTSCGAPNAPDARFCPGCGQPLSGAGPLPAPAFPAVPKLEYEIAGNNLQIARIKLKPGQEVYAEAGKMIYKTPSVSWDTRMSGQSLGEKIWGAVQRKLMGESLFLTYFRTPVPGEAGFAGSYPGKIQAYELAPGQVLMAQRDAFLLAETSVKLNIALVKKLGAGIFGGEGFILEQLTGPGIVFIHAGGDHVEFNLQPGESIQIETGCIVAFDGTVDYDIQMVGNIRSMLFGGEGIFLATLTGPGKVVVQSMTLSKLRRELAPHPHGGDEHKGLDVLSGIFSSDD